MPFRSSRAIPLGLRAIGCHPYYQAPLYSIQYVWITFLPLEKYAANRTHVQSPLGSFGRDSRAALLVSSAGTKAHCFQIVRFQWIWVEVGRAVKNLRGAATIFIMNTVALSGSDEDINDR
jgi:hypothetical protein